MTKHKKSRRSERAGPSSEGGGGIDQRLCESSSGCSLYSLLQSLWMQQSAQPQQRLQAPREDVASPVLVQARSQK